MKNITHNRKNGVRSFHATLAMVFGLIASPEDIEYAGIIHQITFRGDPREAIE
ncbi:MAG: hypothetical protein KUG81_03220 [Gammaproteobacteria bacterium]|nr:hypothetical protein [Gammaproteobacteria bacterium]